MIAANFRKFPEALLTQMELRLDAAAQYFQDLTPTLRGIWTRVLATRKPAKRPAAPSWYLAAQQRAQTLAKAVREACRTLDHCAT